MVAAMARMNLIVFTALCATAASVAVAVARSEKTGCSAYVPASGELVAHAGGGLPDRMYANDADALNLAAQHGFRLIELDFMERDGRLTIGHDGKPESGLSLPELMVWLDAHPGISIVTDVKTPNIAGLALLKQAAGPRVNRFIPQIYHPDQYGPAMALGYPAPILTVYRLGDDGWQEPANALPLRAVTIAVERRHLARQVRHPVFLHTVDEPMEGYGLYTDCLIPAPPAA